MRPTHYNSRTRDELTERQRDVLDLIARGKTNPQIADALGMTLDGAKFHVSEILTKLDVSTREEAAQWWRRERSVKVRALRSVDAAFGAWRWLALGGGTLALAAVAVVTILSMTSGRDEPVPQQSPTPSATQRSDTTLMSCTAGDVTLSLAMVTRQDDVQIVLSTSGQRPCSLNAQANVFLMTLASIPSGVDVPDVRGTYPLDQQFPFSGSLTKWDWSNWCWDTTLPFQWRLNLNDAQGNLIGNGATIDVDTFPPCQDANAASTLSLDAPADFSHDVATITGNNVVGP